MTGKLVRVIVKQLRSQTEQLQHRTKMERSGYLQTSYAGIVECCDEVVNPLLLLGLIGGKYPAS